MSTISSSTTTTTGFKVTSDTTGTLVLQTGATPTTAVTIDGSQNVGMGVTSPAYRLQFSNGSSTTILGVDNAGDNSGAGIALLGGSTVKNWFIGNQYNVNGGLEFTPSTATGGSTFTTPAMVLDSSGNLLVGTTSLLSTERLNVTKDVGDWLVRYTNTNASTPGGQVIYYSGAAPNGTGSQFHYCYDTGGQRFGVRSNGGIANYSANNVNLSDRKEKTDFEPAKSYIDAICAIPVQTYKYIDQTDEEKTLGVVAQDVQAVAPELVTESNWGTEEEPKMRLSIYQTDLQYALMKCIQEQQAIIQAQAADIAALKEKVGI
jgi:hypothetical protein